MGERWGVRQEGALICDELVCGLRRIHSTNSKRVTEITAMIMINIEIIIVH